MPLLQPSFRGRLRLFFAVIVIVPIIAVGVVLFQVLDAGDNFKLDSRLAQAQTGAQNLYKQDRLKAMAALTPVKSDVALATAIKGRQAAAVRERLQRLMANTEIKRVQLIVDGFGTFETGDRSAIAAAAAVLQDNNGQTIGRITVSVTTATGYTLE